MNELRIYLRIRFFRHLALILVATNLAGEPTLKKLSETNKYCSDTCFKEHITGNTSAIFTKDFFYQLFGITMYADVFTPHTRHVPKHKLCISCFSLYRTRYNSSGLVWTNQNTSFFFLTKELHHSSPVDQRKCTKSWRLLSTNKNARTSFPR